MVIEQIKTYRREEIITLFHPSKTSLYTMFFVLFPVGSMSLFGLAKIKHCQSVGEMNPGYPKEAHFLRLLKPARSRQLHHAGCITPAGLGRLHLPGCLRPAGLKPDQPTDSSVLVGEPRVTAQYFLSGVFCTESWQ